MNSITVAKSLLATFLQMQSQIFLCGGISLAIMDILMTPWPPDQPLIPESGHERG